MRIYQTFTEALNEIARDLREMGLRVENVAMQDRQGEFPTRELINYGYVVTRPNPDELHPSARWVVDEWQDRLAGINGNPRNPGHSIGSRNDGLMNWDEYLEVLGNPRGNVHPDNHLPYPELLAYTYSERFALNQQVWRVIDELRRNPLSRQLYIGMWDPDIDSGRIGWRRVPCSLGWHFMMRYGTLNVTYTMRSCDFVTHMRNDLWLTCRLRDFIADMVGVERGSLTHFVNSLHVYEKDVADVF